MIANLPLVINKYRQIAHRSLSSSVMAGVLLGASVLLFVLALQFGRDNGGRIATYTVTPVEYQSQHVLAPEFATGPTGQLTSYKVSLSSNVDNSWLFVKAAVVDEDGATVSEFSASIAYYHGLAGGRVWEVGKQDVAIKLMLPSGRYQLRVIGIAGRGASKEPDTIAAGRPLSIVIYKSGVDRGLVYLALFALTIVFSIAYILKTVESHQQAKEVRSAPAALPTALKEGPPRTASERYLFLDGLRGLAALAVVFCHFLVPEESPISTTLSETLPTFLQSLMRHGDLGVEVFFVLSGFVIAYSIRNNRVSPQFAARFALRRAVRLDPPYYLAILLYLIVRAMPNAYGLSGVIAQMHGISGIFLNLFYLQDLTHVPAVISIAWTLCLEIQFYLAYLLLLAFVQRIRDNKNSRVSKAAHLLVYAPLAVYSVSVWYPKLQAFNFFGTWFRFFLGVLVFLVFRREVSRWWLYGMSLMIMSLAVAFADVRGVAAVSTALLIHFAADRARLTTWLSSRWIQHLGRLSYSLYLTHLLVGFGLLRLLCLLVPAKTLAIPLCLITIIASIGGAQIVHRYFEAPGIRIGKRITY